MNLRTTVTLIGIITTVLVAGTVWLVILPGNWKIGLGTAALELVLGTVVSILLGRAADLFLNMAARVSGCMGWIVIVIGLVFVGVTMVGCIFLGAYGISTSAALWMRAT